MTIRAAALLSVLLLGGCIPYPGEAPDDGRGSSLPSLATNVYPPLDAGANELQTLHFKIHAYGSQNAQEIGDMAEAAYTRIMTDTGLYSFQPHGLYEITVYGSQDEYRKKTGQQDWSAGVTAGGNAIYVFYSPYTNGVVSHEITHLIWFEYMNGRLSEQTRWVNEGLAVYEEAKARNRGQELFSGLIPTMRASPIPLDQLQNLAPSNENGYSVSLWYAQAESMIRFMIEKGGRIGFGQFLEAVKNGQNFDAAIYAGFPGQWRTLTDFENDWKRSLL